MARIPSGDQFGGVIAAPSPQINRDPAAYGAGVGQALQHAGQIGMNMAGNDMAQAAAEQKQMEREAAAEAKQAAAEARRIKALTATAKVQNGLADLHDQIGNELDTGALDKTKAGETWSERSTKLTNDALAEVDPENRDLVGATLLNDVGRYRQSVNKMVTAKDKKDILAGGLSYFEEMQRYAARGPKQADEAIKNVSAFWTATGPMAGEDAANAAKRVQQFSENIRSRQATDLVNVDPGAALKALKNKDYLPELDPDKRSALIQTADAAVLRNQQRGAIAAEAAARQQAKAWDAAQTVFQSGKMPTAEYAAQLAAQFKGTPYAAAFKTMMTEAPANVAFVTQPVQVQAQSLIQLQNKMNQGGATPEQIKEYERQDKAHKATLADIKEDPYKAAAERGVLTSLEPLTLDAAKLPEQLAKRGEAARQVSQWAGQEVSLFRPDEANKVAGVLQAMPPRDRAGMLSGLAKSMTPGQMRSFAKQLGAKDDSLAAAAMLSGKDYKTTSGRLASEVVLLGADALKEQRVKFPTGQSQTQIRAEIDTLTRGAFLSEDANRAAGDAAMSAYAGLLAEGKTPSINSAVSIATGGIMDLLQDRQALRLGGFPR